MSAWEAKTLVALDFWILEFDDVTCIRSIRSFLFEEGEHLFFQQGSCLRRS